ncbi:MAG: membrane protein insertase YidC [Elusimicrobiota bacterium]
MTRWKRGGVNMEKRLLLAIIASVAVLYLFQATQAPQVPVDTEVTAPESEPRESQKDIADEDTDLVPQPLELEEEQSEVISNGDILVEISSLGSGIRRFEIKDEKEGMVDLVVDREPPLPLYSSLAGNKNWNLRKTGERSVSAQIDTETGSFYREFNIREDNVLEITNRISNRSDDALEYEVTSSWRGGLGSTEDQLEDNPDDNEVFAKIDGEVERKLDEGSHSGNIEWAGLYNRFFFLSFLDVDDVFSRVRVFFNNSDEEEYPSVEITGSVEAGAQEDVEFKQNIYGGLKEYRKMKGLAEGMEDILSFGIFGFLSRLFLQILLAFNSFVNNFGVAIIMLTVLLQFFLIPLTVKSYKSMHAMKELQPAMEKIKNKYKDDPQRMNQEMMAMYKRRGVNPLSGCFPLLLQMPIFISLFTMLREVAELRYASFLWIGDLSAPDTLFASLPVLRQIPYIGQYGPLPFLMGGAMFLQQKATSGSKGPQKSMTYMMPVIFTFLFMGFPAGLVLYWLSNSILTFGIQFFIGKKT